MKKLLKLENLIYLTVAGLPLYLVKLNFFGLPANILDVLEAAVFFWWFLDKSRKKPKISEIIFNYKDYLIPMALILFGLLTSTFSNGGYGAGLGIIKSWFILPFLFAFVSAETLGLDKRKNLFKAFYCSAFAVSTLSLVYYFFGRLTYDGRLSGIFNSPNYLAMYLSPAVIIGAVLFRENRKFYASSLAIIILALYLTNSYASWVALALALIAALAFCRRFSLKIFAVIILTVVIFLLTQLGTGKWNNLMLIKERSSLSSRVMIWKTAEKIAADNPIWGIGPGNFQEKYLEYQKFFPPYLEWAVPHPHNLYLAFWLQTGLFGLAGFVLLLFFWFKVIFKAERSDLRGITLGIIFYILLHGFVDTTYFKNDLSVIFWLSFLASK